MSQVRFGYLKKRATNLFWCFHEKPFHTKVHLQVYSFEIKIIALIFYILLCSCIILCKVIQHVHMYSCYCSPFHTYIPTTFSHLLRLLADQSSVVFHCLSFHNAQRTGVLALGTVHLPIRILSYRLLSLRVVRVLLV